MDGWIWEIVSGGLETNWWARAGCESTWASVAELGVEVSERRAWACARRVGVDDKPVEEGSAVSVALILRSGVATMSPGATWIVSWDGYVGCIGLAYRSVSLDDGFRDLDACLRRVCSLCWLDGLGIGLVP